MSGGSGADRQRDLSGRANLDWEKQRAEIWESAFSQSNQSQEAPSQAAESQPASTAEREKYLAWLHEFLNDDSTTIIGKLFGAGCDIFFLLEFTYEYCSPEPTAIDDFAAKTRSLSAIIPDHIREIRRLSKKLRQLETPERLKLLGEDIKPNADRLERYADRLEAARSSLKEASTKGSFRPFFLLTMSYYLRGVFPERWRGLWMRKAVHADIRDLVNAGFRANGMDRDVSEDQVRRLCERFSEKHPSFAKYAQQLSLERPIKCENVYERLFQDALRRVSDKSSE